MTYEVVIQPGALRDLEQAKNWAAQHAPLTARRWLNRFIDSLYTLQRNPERCALAPEARKANRDIRQFLFGKRANVYRALFVISNQQVRIFRVMRGQRRTLTRRQIDEAIDPDTRSELD